MIKSEKFITTCNFAKKGFNIYDYTKTLVRHTELTKALENKAYTEGLAKLTTAYPGIAISNLTEKQVLDCLEKSTDSFLRIQKEVDDLKEEIKVLPITWEQVTSLPEADLNRVYVYAWTICPSISLKRDNFSWAPVNEKDEKINLIAPIVTYYKNGRGLSKIKASLSSSFHRMFGVETDNFYAVNFRKSCFSDEMVRHYISRFSGNINKSGEISYIVKEDKDLLLRAFTELSAVMLTVSDRHDVVKPEATKKEKKK